MLVGNPMFTYKVNYISTSGSAQSGCGKDDYQISYLYLGVLILNALVSFNKRASLKYMLINEVS